MADDTNPQTPEENDNAEFQYTVTQDEQGREVSAVKKDKDGKVVETTETTYNEDGSKSSVTKDADGKITGDMNYDKHGEVKDFGEYEDGKLVARVEGMQDENGVSHVMRKDPDGKLISDRAYNDNDELQSKKIYNEAGEVTSEFEYDEEGKEFRITREGDSVKREATGRTRQEAHTEKDVREGDSMSSNEPQQEEIDLSKEADEMRRWLDLYEKEGKEESSDFKMPYAKIAGISPVNPKDPKSGMNIRLDTGTELKTEQSKISMKHKDREPSLEDCMTMVRMGQKRGWTVANLKGSENFKRQMYLACMMLGMEVKGYNPPEEVKQQAQQMLKAQEEAKATGTPTLAEKAKDLDARTVNGTYTPPVKQQAETRESEQAPLSDENKKQIADDYRKSRQNLGQMLDTLGKGVDLEKADNAQKAELALKAAIAMEYVASHTSDVVEGKAQGTLKPTEIEKETQRRYDKFKSEHPNATHADMVQKTGELHAKAMEQDAAGAKRYAERLGVERPNLKESKAKTAQTLVSAHDRIAKFYKDNGRA